MKKKKLVNKAKKYFTIFKNLKKKNKLKKALSFLIFFFKFTKFSLRKVWSASNVKICTNLYF